MKHLLSILASLLMIVAVAKAQDPVTWTMDVKMTSKTAGVVTLAAKILPGWHLYSTKLDPSIGPKPTSITMSNPAGMKWTAPLKPNVKATTQYDNMWEAKISYWTKAVKFTRPFKITGNKAVTVTATVSFQACNDENCTADTKKFSKTITPKK